jgi:tetratricopeptide (TPR) repeat protein
MELSPHYSLSHEWYSALLVGTGRYTEGNEEMRRAEQLDPLSLRTKIMVVWSYYQSGDLDAALAKAEEVIGLDEKYPQGHVQRGHVLSELGRTEEAIAEIEVADQLMPGSGLVQFNLCFAYAAAGRKADAVKLADAMIERFTREYVKPIFLFFANVAAGRFDIALHYLEVSVEERDPWLAWLGTEPKLKVIRDDPRFTELLQRTNKTIENGKVRIFDEAIEDFTSTWRSETNTAPEAELHTQGVKPSLFARHRWKFAAAGLFVVALVGAYAAGILNVNLAAGTRPIMHAIKGEPVKSVAVLPFENATGDPANDYISDGMSDSLIGRISKAPTIRIVPRATAFEYRNKSMDPIAIGTQLGVESVLTGTLRREGDSFAIRLEMVCVNDGRKQLSMSFAEKPDRMFALQDAMFAKVVDALELEFPPTNLAKQHTENNEAFQLYLKGEYSRQKGTPAAVSESIEDYKKAIEIDPDYALAHAGLALAYRVAPAYGAMTPQEAYPRVKEEAQKALDLDPSLTMAYVALASAKATYDWDFAGAEQEYKRALSVTPNSSETRYSYGNLLVAMGRTEEALVQLRNALQNDPLSLNVMTNIAWALYISGKYTEAENQIRLVIERDPTFARAYLTLGEIQQEQGRFDEAIKSIDNFRQLSQDPLADMALGHVYATAGRKAEALKIATDLEEKVRQKQVSPFLPAVVYAGINDKDKAFYWLERAFQERSNWLTLIKVGRRLKNLHGDPRFDDLVKRIGFTN